jgi:hypothetical protein
MSDFDRLLFFRFKTKTDLKEFIFNLIFNFNRGPYAYLKMNQMFLKIYTWMKTNWMNNRMSDTGLGEPLIYYKSFCHWIRQKNFYRSI